MHAALRTRVRNVLQGINAAGNQRTRPQSESNKSQKQLFVKDLFAIGVNITQASTSPRTKPKPWFQLPSQFWFEHFVGSDRRKHTPKNRVMKERLSNCDFLNLRGLFQIPPFSFRCCRLIEMN